MKERILYLDGTTSTIKSEIVQKLVKFDASRQLYTIRYENRNYRWCNNTWMEE